MAADDESQDGDPLIGQVVDGRYRIERILGEGGMGVVYQASHTALGKRFALKVLRGEMSRDDEVAQRFIQEAQSSTAIGHENIIDISDFGRLEDGTAYFVMEYLAGETLTEFINRGELLPMLEATRILEQVASALGAAHARGIVHRDMKPDNIFLTERGDNPRFVKVLDFGIAKVGGANSKLTRTGTVFGTPHYMSPEQAAGQFVDARSDIYALGVIMYELFTGEVPFDGDTFMGILSKHMFEEPPPPNERVHARDLAAEPIILRCLAKRPEDRYESMEAVISDLRTIADGGAVSVGSLASVPAPPNMASALAPGARSGQGGPSMFTIVALASVALLLGGALIGGAFAWFSSHENAAVTMSDSDATGFTPQPSPPAAAQPAPVPTPAPPSVEPAAAAPAEPVLVELVTEPAGAMVMADGALIGTTPLALPRPDDAEGLRLSLEMDGYAPLAVRLTRHTSERLSVALHREEPERRSHSSGSRRRHRDRNRAEPVAASPMNDTMQPSMRPRHSEVVDPWSR